ncbi:MAG: hypothetical protein MSIBF_00450 [Candidatus Altiarchaeales archaeon IMC4]|nr:MAG: hypothetical protein MSIBF_00450 [Candidatus Altiarchaeales archaeon IMC4]
MKRKLFLPLLLGFLLLVIFGLFYNSGGPQTHHGNSAVCFGETCVDVEIADEPAERTMGLMYRDGLDKGRGMLFIFETESPYSFWMKNMKFPIDMIWINSAGGVVHIEADVPPCTSDPCQSYTPKGSAKYVLEVPANFTRKRGVAVGDVCQIRVS